MATSLPSEARIVRDVMTPDPIVMRGTATVREAGLAMRRSDVGDVLVVRDDAIFGIVTDRDIVVRNVAAGRDPNRALLDEICSRSLVQVSPDDSIDHAIGLMRERAVRRMPVVVGDTPVGIVSLGDLAAVRDPDSALAEISTAPGNL